MAKAIVGVLVVAAGVYIGNILYTKYLIHQAENALLQMSSELQKQSGQTLQQLSESMQLQNERARQHQLVLEQERTRQKQLEIDFRNAQAEKQLAQQEADRTKEIAWNKFYKKPAQCENISRQDLLVECGNYYVKQKKKFEQIWMANQALAVGSASQ